MKINSVSFKGYDKPQNFKRIDNNVMRSAQPEAEEIVWLKKNKSLTDIINFRTLVVPATDFNEKKLSEALYIKYHSIPTETKHPKISDVKKFLKVIDDVKKQDGQVLIHCKAGADRTGFYSLIYKVLNGLDNFDNAVKEMLEMGYHQDRYPFLTEIAKDFLKKLRK